ncbi:Quino protein alcohol dehydrogenase-like protein [Coniochaeta ligniaria NRRL 30616]|uniref:Quino protein alcohol dehydrogenase-like protein n=1 Tax=Coniochaeta ligniaria NRRL 30616 TaxID=1408157 RepID=A0A1J7ICG4_9PEZI|nr:Quino protein alcohol dehydrogenase-like protein [Coniochaeta ligniaria NRRL 30616]
MSYIAFYVLLILHIAVSVTDAFTSSSGKANDEWTGWGGSLYNNRASSSEYVSSSTMKNVTVHCQIPHVGGVSATPTISNGVAFYPTWGGTFVALDYDKCQVKWEINVTAIIVNFKQPTPFQLALTTVPFIAGLFASRTSPQIDKQTNVLYFATQLNALVVAVDVDTGALLGFTQINPHPGAVATLSPTLYENILYAGVASAEELAAGSVPGYKCCSFVGNAVALKFDRHTGRFKTVWNLSMLPTGSSTGKYSNGSDWSGVGVWGSQPAIDPVRRRVFFATGNVYTAPEAFLNCTDDRFSPTTAQNTSCLPPRVWQNAVLAVDLLTGKVAWVKRFGPLDVWVLACGIGGVVTDLVSCPGTPGPDYDFGMAPTFVPGEGKNSKDVLTIGQKSGYLYSLAADTGEIQWATATSPGGVVGGLSWGIATDDRRVYFTGINSGTKPWTLQPGNNTVVNNSVWGAASLTDGKLLWETPGSGKVLLEYPLKGTFRGGVAVQDRYVLFGTGYKGLDGFLYVLKVSPVFGPR